MHLKINGFEMAFTSQGEGKPLLFVHGFPLNRQLWRPQVEALSRVAHVIAPDLRGHGESQAVPGEHSLELFAEDLNALLDALHVKERVVLCGLSMGGYIAFEFYRRYTTRVDALVLTATRATADTKEGRAAREQMAALVRQEGIASIVEGMTTRLLSPNTIQTHKSLVDSVRQMMNEVSIEGVLGDLWAMKNRPDSTPTLRTITVPTLILHGEEDQIVPQEEARRMAQLIPQAQFIRIPQAGHLPNLEQPEAFNRALQDFIQSLP